jgi:hypothetical protein
MTVERIRADKESELRRWLMDNGDPEFATHRQLRDYFLTESDDFGVLVLRALDGKIDACLFYSRYDGKSYAHLYMGAATGFQELMDHLGYPCQAFLTEDFLEEMDLPASGWLEVLKVRPGFVVDHPAYDGVFSRVAPRFKGSVMEHA